MMQSRPFGAPLFEGSIWVLPHRMASENGSESEGILGSLCQGCSGSLLFKFKMMFFFNLFDPSLVSKCSTLSHIRLFLFQIFYPYQANDPSIAQNPSASTPNSFTQHNSIYVCVVLLQKRKTTNHYLAYHCDPNPWDEVCHRHWIRGRSSAAALRSPK